jgi:hypothetical protein
MPLSGMEKIILEGSELVGELVDIFRHRGADLEDFRKLNIWGCSLRLNLGYCA